MPTYLTFAEPVSAEPEPIKKSRFLANGAPIASPEEAMAWVATIEARYPDARHHAYAWRLATTREARTHDAGEPGGSAGPPILNHLDGAKLEGICMVVTRYFGGTKLGVGGLIRAYGGAAGEAIRAAEIVEVRATRQVLVDLSYAEQGSVEGVLRGFGLELRSPIYSERISASLDVPLEDVEAVKAALIEATSGRIRL